MSPLWGENNGAMDSWGDRETLANHSLVGSKADSRVCWDKEPDSKTNLRVTRPHTRESSHAEKICDSVFVPVWMARVWKLRVFVAAYT